MEGYNEFGKFLRCLRIEQGEIMKDMADKLGISIAYLSSLETGRKEIPKDMYGKIKKIYNIGILKGFELQRAISKSKRTISIDIQNCSDDKKELAFVFARDLDHMSEEATKNFLEQFNKKNEGE